MNLTPKKIVITILIVAYLLVNIGWGIFVKEVGYKGGMFLTSSSIKESKMKNCFIEELSIKPNGIKIEGIELLVKDVWLEKSHDLSMVISIIPKILEYKVYKQTEDYNVIMNFQNNDTRTLNEWFFVIKGRRNSFSNRGDHLSETLKDNRWNSIPIVLTKDWTFSNTKKFELKKLKPSEH